MGQRSFGTDISVVIVCLNALGKLKETLDSLATVAGWQPRVYVVDGASRDGTLTFLASRRDALSGWISAPDRGIYDAMNKGWDMAHEDSFVLFLGAGDKLLSLPSRESLADDRRRGIDIILGTCELDGGLFRSEWNRHLRTNNTAHHQALMVHKSLCAGAPFDISFKVYGDWDFNARLFAAGTRAQHHDEFRSYASPGGISASIFLFESFRVGMWHGGPINGVRALVRAWKARMKAR